MKKSFLLFISIFISITFLNPVFAQGFVQPTLSGENLYGLTQDHTQNNCVINQPYSVNFNIVNKYASNPYAGTFSESGNLTIIPQSNGTAIVSSFTSNYVINSFIGIVSGTKTLNHSEITYVNCSYYDGLANIFLVADYSATIMNNGYTFFDKGTAKEYYYFGGQTINPASLGEEFTSSTTKLNTIAPVNKNDCKSNGYQHFVNPDTLLPFTNQGECIKSVNKEN